MIKGLSLFLKNEFYRLTRKVPKGPLGYDQALNIGILIHNPDHACNYAINDFVKELKKDGKKVEVICFINKDLNRIYEFPFIELTSKDIGWKGNFKQEKINKFIKTEFDYLYSINILPFLPFQNIILKSRSKFRIGYYFQNQDNQRKPFDFMVSLREGEKLDTLVKNMMTYTKKIK
jgi:hypothetical protein